MAIVLDGRQISDEGLTPGATVAHAADLAKAALHGSGRLILSVVCDGDEIDAQRLKDVLRSPYGQFAAIEFLSGAPHAAVRDALVQAQQIFAESFAQVREVSAALSSGDIPAAMQGLVHCVAAWSNMHEAVVQGGALVDVDFDRLVLGGRHVLDWLGDLNQRLRDMRDAIESRDHVMLGDILNYEIDETLRGWETMLREFTAHVDRITPRECANTP